MAAFELIASRGRLGDRSARTIEGAGQTARALEDRYGLTARYVGVSKPPVDDDWRLSLAEAEPTLRELAAALEDSFQRAPLTVLAANTCSASLATLPVVARHFPDVVVLWIDAHGDFNTPETTRSGYLGGMVLAAACGVWDSGHGSGVDPARTLVIGARDVDADEQALLEAHAVRLVSPTEVDFGSVVSAIGDAPVWIHIDWDAMEPGYVPADYKVAGGLLPHQLQDLFSAIPPGRVRGLELAEFHPGQDDHKNQLAIATVLDIISPLLSSQAR